MTASAPPTTASLYDIGLQALDGQPTTLAPYQGEVLLIVNVASKCGLTPQYTALQALHERYSGRGLRVLGFPCNDFAGQEPGSEDEIRTFCDTNYQITFPLFGKLNINCVPRHALYAALIAALPQTQGSGNSKLHDTLAQHKLLPKQATDVMWNFEKFLVDRHGQPLARFAPDVAPDDAALVQAIEAALG